MKPAKDISEYCHLIINHVNDKEHGALLINQLEHIHIYISAYEETNTNRHIHAIVKILKPYRYINGHKPFKQKLRHKIIKKTQEDLDNVVNYILKNGDIYQDEEDIIIDEFSIENIPERIKKAVEQHQSHKKSKTQYYIKYFKDNKELLKTKYPKSSVPERILKEIINLKKQNNELIQKNYIVSLLQTLVLHEEPIYLPYEQHYEESILAQAGFLN